MAINARTRRLFVSVSFVALSAMFVFSPLATVLAQTAAVEEVGTAAGFGSGDLTTIIGSIISTVLLALGVIFLLLLIASGFFWMTAGGNEDKVKRAKRILINATIGLVITLSSYAIASFILNALGDATGYGNGTGNGAVTIEPRSGSLGSGIVRDHYPSRNATGVARNARIMITFAEPMDLESFIDGYDTNGTPDDVTDDTTATLIRSGYVSIYPSDNESAVLTNVNVYFTDDLQTLVFDPIAYLGSPTANTSYTVSLNTNIKTAANEDAFTGAYSGGYEWSFEVSTELDLTPPTVQSVIPSRGAEYDRNIAVEITFDEAIDPTSATGTRTETTTDDSGVTTLASGFENINIVGTSGDMEAGSYSISNGYRTVSYTSTDACGTNSCGETIYCLPGDDAFTVTARAASTTTAPPQADAFPYDGVTDVSANALDGNDDGTAGDDYAWDFTTSNEIYLIGPAIETISPAVLSPDQALDQLITITFDSIMRTSTLTNENITMDNQEITSGEGHEMWYLPSSASLDSSGAEVLTVDQTPVQTRTTVGHGVFLESTGGLTYLYGVLVNEGVENQYQNCYSPADGPDATGGVCDVDDPSSACCLVDDDTPSCCNGAAQTGTCDYFPDVQ